MYPQKKLDIRILSKYPNATQYKGGIGNNFIGLSLDLLGFNKEQYNYYTHNSFLEKINKIVEKRLKSNTLSKYFSARDFTNYLLDKYPTEIFVLEMLDYKDNIFFAICVSKSFELMKYYRNV